VVKRGKRRGIFGLIAMAAVLAALIAAGSAFGVAQTIVGNDTNTWSQATYTMDQGDRPLLQNVGINQHNATASVNGPDGRPLFETPTIGTGTAQLDGTQYLTTGSYVFICTVHPSTMIATLAVSANGTPQPRPSVALKVLSKSIEKVAAKGRLPIQVQATTAAQDVDVEAKLGKRSLGKVDDLNLAAGARQTIALKLAKAVRNTLRNKDKATVSVEGTVRFGAPVSTKGKLK
jgi:plastocyanin